MREIVPSAQSVCWDPSCISCDFGDHKFTAELYVEKWCEYITNDYLYGNKCKRYR